MEDVCLLPQPKDIVFPEDRTNQEMHLLCNKLRGHMSASDSQAKQDALAVEYKRMMPEKYKEGWKGKLNQPHIYSMKHQLLSPTAMFWAGWNDNSNEGNFINYLDGKVLRKEDGFWPWYPGEPNGGVLENCAAVWPSRDAWFDYMCFEKAQGFCKIQPRPRLIMRGGHNLT